MAAKKIKTVAFPDWLATTDCKIETSVLGEDGGPEKSFSHSGKCIYSVKNKAEISKEGKNITITGKVILKGDIAPKMKDDELASGTVEIKEQKFSIYSVSRPRNPNGTVHHTTFEVY